MAGKASKPCRQPGCPGLVRNSVCSVCGRRAPKHGWPGARQRGATTQRGYDGQWQKLRAAYLRSHPLCVKCKEEGRTEPAVHVHHLAKFHGLNDPLRLDPSNLVALCRRCHMAAEGTTHRGS